jgi:hypothetical protein
MRKRVDQELFRRLVLAGLALSGLRLVMANLPNLI